MYKGILFVFICTLCVVVYAQNKDAIIQIVDGEKDVYSVGDEVSMEIKVTLPPEICSEGMENVKMYLSGLNIEEEQPWIKENESDWTRKLKLKIIRNKKSLSKITVFRKADKGSFFSQLELKVHDNIIN